MEKVEVIKKIWARQILDSRGNPTVEVDMWTENGFFGRASVPSGASTGINEALELRDGNPKNYLGKSVEKAVYNVNHFIAPKIVGMNVFEQEEIDKKMITLDGTANKSKFGANAILAVSLASCKTASAVLGVPLFEYISKGKGYTLPIPMYNVINGGKHADNNLNIQEFMIMPIGAKNFTQCLQMTVTVFQNLKKLIKKNGLSTAVGDEGGFAPNLDNDEQALDYICQAIELSGYEKGKDFCLALDVASSEMYNEAEKIGKKGYYYFWKTDKLFSPDELSEYYKYLMNKYPIISIEDGFAEEDWTNWSKFTSALGNKLQIVGDDLFVTNSKFLDKGIAEGAANSILIKLNQIGTVTETLQTILTAQKAGYTTVISHRSGETEDTSIADLALATNSGQIKTGAPSRTDRVAKYNQLIRIEEYLGKKAKFGKIK